eukprot:TRINITY_DN10334_c0_g2_i1.p1 TRINITY_DN10334_c0_g2~~TRINITY_DN10334_c0_g2_i1.p1  ORF type:complete len:425 (-),score=98.73 TRINITY_DN10334_c0_g2_i1:42-1316(-)
MTQLTAVSYRRVGEAALAVGTALLVGYLFRRKLRLLVRRPGSACDEKEEEQSNDGSRGPALVRGNFVLLATFDGIRGCSAALTSLGVEPLVDYSSEVEENCQKLIAAKYPRCIQLGDVRKLDQAALAAMVAEHGTHLPWLVVGGSPCQDLSCRRGPKRRGLEGKKSKLFYEFVRVINSLLALGVQVAFLLENVASMPDSERDKISFCLGVEPQEIDSAVVSGCHRQRYYWTNLPVEPLQPRTVDIDSMLQPGWQRVPPGKPFRCFVSKAVFHASRGRGELGVRHVADGTERPPNADEREAILGFPRGHTRLRHAPSGEEIFSEGLRMKLLGNSFSVQVVSHLLSPIAAYVLHGAPLMLQPLRDDALVLTMNRIVGDERSDADADADGDAGADGGADGVAGDAAGGAKEIDAGFADDWLYVEQET